MIGSPAPVVWQSAEASETSDASTPPRYLVERVPGPTLSHISNLARSLKARALIVFQSDGTLIFLML